MNNEIELARWKLFLQDKSSELPYLLQRACLVRFPDPDVLINHEQFSTNFAYVYPDIKKAQKSKKISLSDPVNSCRGYLTKIYNKFGFGNDKLSGSDDYKSKVVFDSFCSEFTHWKHSLGFSSPPISHSNKFEQLHELLLNLNYTKEEAYFKDSVVNLCQPGIFLSEIDDYDTQRWLTNRLVTNSITLKTPYGKGIKANSKWKKDLDYFWQWLSESEEYKFSNRQDIIQRFCDRSKEEPILMAIYNVDILREDDLKQIVEGFWVPFQKMIQRPDRFDSKECILFLVGKPGWIAEKQNCFSNESVAITLPAWHTTTARHIHGWLRNPKVFDFCTLHSRKNFPDILEFFEITQSMLEPGPDYNLGTPSRILENICGLLDVSSIAELESNWRIKA
jgi:inactive STAND